MADREQAVKNVCNSAFGNSGQNVLQLHFSFRRRSL